MRTLMAALMTLALFGGAASLFQVKGKSLRVMNRATARVMVLEPDDADSREILEWARQYSPFPDRWEPRVDPVLRRQMESLDLPLAERSRYTPLLWHLPERETEYSLPELFDPAKPPLPPVERVPPRATPRPVARSWVFADAGKLLSKRWGERATPLRALLPEPGGEEDPAKPLEFLGLERRFLVGVDPHGEVIFCQAVDESETELDEVLARWLRGHRLKPDETGSENVWGVVRVSVRGLQAKEEEDKAP